MHAVEAREVVDRQLVEDVLAEQVALAHLERGHRQNDGSAGAYHSRHFTNGGNVGNIGTKLFTDYLFAFELTSALLITAALGAMILAFVGRDGKPARKTQKWAGTDRQVRGKLLQALRDAHGPLPRTRLDLVWSDAAQRDRCLAGLIEDGLVEPLDDDLFALPG